MKRVRNSSLVEDRWQVTDCLPPFSVVKYTYSHKLGAFLPVLIVVGIGAFEGERRGMSAHRSQIHSRRPPAWLATGRVVTDADAEEHDLFRMQHAELEALRRSWDADNSVVFTKRPSHLLRWRAAPQRWPLTRKWASARKVSLEKCFLHA